MKPCMKPDPRDQPLLVAPSLLRYDGFLVIVSGICCGLEKRLAVAHSHLLFPQEALGGPARRGDTIFK